MSRPSERDLWSCACPLCEGDALLPLPVPPQMYFHCQRCDLRFLSPSERLNAQHEKERYAAHNNDVDDLGYQRFLEPLFREIKARVSPNSIGLDFGAGPGPALARMFEISGHSMSLYDPFFWPDRGALVNQTYDFVTASEVVEHFYSPHQEFRRLYQLLKPGAWLGIMTLLFNQHSATDFANWYYRRDPSHVAFFSRNSFEWIQREYEFEQLTWSGERIVLLRRPL
jgi:hypothetical protein